MRRDDRVRREMMATETATRKFEAFKDTLLSRCFNGEMIGPIGALQEAFFAGWRDGRLYRPLKKLCLLGLVSLCGCDPAPTGMPWEEQLAKVNACKKAGGRVSESRYADGGAVARVNCYFTPDDGEDCRKKGGVAILSSWDGTLKNCVFKGGK